MVKVDPCLVMGGFEGVTVSGWTVDGFSVRVFEKSRIGNGSLLF